LISLGVKRERLELYKDMLMVKILTDCQIMACEEAAYSDNTVSVDLITNFVSHNHLILFDANEEMSKT